jgi:4-hydroxybenzoate polyprenyltransferase
VPTSSSLPTGRTRAWLQLLRPATVATALADVLTGAAVAGAGWPLGPAVQWLLVATACLYAGGIVLNDYFDRTLDATERPERPIPSGQIGAAAAGVTGAALSLAGIFAASQAGPAAALIATSTVVAVLSYDAWAKHRPFLGPANMGLCRALNLMLGVSATPATLATAWPLGLLPLGYIAAVTMVSRGEVQGGKRPVLVAAIGLVSTVVLALTGLVIVRAFVSNGSGNFTGLHTLWSLALVAWLAGRIFPALLRAARTLAPGDIRHAVRTGVLSLVLLNAVIAASYAGIIYSLAVLATGLLALALARLFAVT